MNGITLTGKSRDINGNGRIKFQIDGVNFSIQTNNGSLRETHRLLRNNLFDELDGQEIAAIEAEVREYIKQHGTKRQRELLFPYK